MGTINFFLESLKNLKTVGTLIPCSSIAAEKTTKPVDFSSAKLIIKFGGGTGVITRKILANMRKDAELIVFEINTFFAETLKNLNDPRLTIINDSAVKPCDYLKLMDIKKADYIISTLPLAIMNQDTVAKVLEEVINVLDTRGYYIQIQYSLFSKKDIKEKFSMVKLDFTLFNFPPAFFYICERQNNHTYTFHFFIAIIYNK